MTGHRLQTCCTHALSAAFASLLVSNVFGQTVQPASKPDDIATELPLVEVTITRSERQIDLITQPTSVITSSDINSRPATNVQSLLADVPGITFSRAGGLGGQINMRGSNSNDPRLVLFIDGERFRGRNTLEYNLIDPNHIERIEVLRGPGSALYGADAMVGVVNIITRRARRSGGDFALTPRLRALEYESASDLRGIRAELEGSGRSGDFLLSAGRRDAGDYESGAGLVRNSDFTQQSLDFSGGLNLATNQRLELVARYANIESGRAGGIAGAPGDPLIRARENPIRERYIKIGYAASKLWGIDKIDASLYVRTLETNLNTEDRTVANRLAIRDVFVDAPVVYGGKLVLTKAVGNVAATGGADFFHENREGSDAQSITFNTLTGAVTARSPRARTGPNAQQTNVGTFLRLDWDPTPRFTGSAGLRYDQVKTELGSGPIPALFAPSFVNASNTESATTGSLGVVWRAWEKVHLAANAGTGFRVPATFEAFGFSPGARPLIPNPQLKPETAVTVDIGARLRTANAQASLTVFHTEFEDLIVRKTVTFEGNPLASQRQNIGRAEVQGIEVDGRWDFMPRWALLGGLTLLRGTDTLSNRPLPYIAPLSAHAALRHQLTSQLSVEGRWRGFGKKTRIDPAEERPLAGSAVLDLFVHGSLKSWGGPFSGFTIAAGVANVFDKAFASPTTVEAVNFPRGVANPVLEPGRSFLVTLRSAL